MSKKKEQWITVVHRQRGSDHKFDLGVAFSVDHWGAKEAVRLAQAYLEHEAKMLSNLEFKLEGDEW